MSKLISEYDNWADEGLVYNIWGGTVCPAQNGDLVKSPITIQYIPMWFSKFL